MSKLSLHAVDQMYQSNSDDPILLLLDFQFPNNDSYYLVNNSEDIVHNSQTYTAFPFTFILPDDSEDSQPDLTISLSNIGLELIESFRSNIQDVTGSIKVVFASFPDFAELEINGLKIKSINYDKSFINVSIGYEDILTVSIPSESYTPTEFPGLYSV